MNDTLQLLNTLAWESCRKWARWDAEAQAMEAQKESLYQTFRAQYGQDRALLYQVNDLLDTQYGLEEYIADRLFLYGLQLGLELGALRVLGER